MAEDKELVSTTEAVTNVGLWSQPGRRLHAQLPGRKLSWSVPASVSDEDAIAEMIRCQASVERGWYRKAWMIDGPDTIGEWIAVTILGGIEYLKMWTRVAWNWTVGRGACERRIAETTAALKARSQQ